MLQRTCLALLVQPIHWLFFFFFQPQRFRQDFENFPRYLRILCMLRLALPIVVCNFLLAFVCRSLLADWFPVLYNSCSANGLPGHTDLCFLIDTARGTFLGSIGCLLAALFFDLTFSTAFCIASGFVGGVMVDTKTDIGSGVLIGLEFACLCGLTLGTLLGLTAHARKNVVGARLFGNITSSAIGLVLGGFIGMVCGFLSGLIIGNIAGDTLTMHHTTGSIGGVVGGIIGGLAVGIVAVIVQGIARDSRAVLSIRHGIQFGKTIAITFGAIVGTVSGTIGILAASQNQIVEGLRRNLTLGIEVCIVAGLVFGVNYLCGYYRLPLYPIDALCMLYTYIICRIHKVQIIRYLWKSPLLWDEYVFLQLPFSRVCLVYALQQSRTDALNLFEFIINQRSLQRRSAFSTLQELLLVELNTISDIRDISCGEEILMKLFPSDYRLIDDGEWFAPFLPFVAASHEAKVYLSHTNKHARSVALDCMISHLNKICPDEIPDDSGFHLRLHTIAHKWESIVSRCQVPDRDLNDPYRPATILRPGDPQFVGRNDIVQRVSETLRRQHCTAFFLEGERRMGKSSILQRLHMLLGYRYIRIFYDLQLPGLTASTATFLSMVAHEIHKEMVTKGLHPKRLESDVLREAALENEKKMIYYQFELWLREVETALDRSDFVLLLCFDEFEYLAEASLDLQLLLNWFRNIIQHHPRLILLFSGVRAPHEVDPGWSSYFVNVEILHISFLKVSEAHHLITNPTPDFPGEKIFGEQVVAEIIRLTACHPFLIHALCSKLIIRLNDMSQQQATLADIQAVIFDVLEAYNEYFMNQWRRCNASQRQCLIKLAHLVSRDIFQLEAELELAHTDLVLDLKILTKRDLVIHEDAKYRIAIPLFHEWIVLNNPFST